MISRIGQVVAVLLFVPIFLGTALAAADFWEDKDFTTWSQKEVEKMLSDSPWSRKVSLHIPEVSLAGRVGGLSGGLIGTGGGAGRAGGGGGAGGAGAGNLGGGGFLPPPRRTQVPLRWVSALPVKQASVMERGEGATPPPTDPDQFLQQEERQYRLAVVGLARAFGSTLSDLQAVRGATLLKRKDRAPIAAVDVRLVYHGEWLSIEFHFPKDESITLDEKEVEFVTVLGEAKLSKKFKLKDMVIAGRLVL